MNNMGSTTLLHPVFNNLEQVIIFCRVACGRFSVNVGDTPRFIGAQGCTRFPIVVLHATRCFQCVHTEKSEWLLDRVWNWTASFGFRGFGCAVVRALAFHLWGCGFDSQWGRCQCYIEPSAPLMWKELAETLCRKSWVFSGRSGFLPQGSWQGELGLVHTSAFSNVCVFVRPKTHRSIRVHTTVFVAYSTVHTKTLENADPIVVWRKAAIYACSAFSLATRPSNSKSSWSAKPISCSNWTRGRPR